MVHDHNGKAFNGIHCSELLIKKIGNGMHDGVYKEDNAKAYRQ